MELRSKLVTTSPVGGWVAAGRLKTKLMLISTQIEAGVEVRVACGNRKQIVPWEIKMVEINYLALNCRD